MVTYDLEGALRSAARLVAAASGKGPLQCPICGVGGFTEDELWQHVPLYHVNAGSATDLDCPVCGAACGRRGKSSGLRQSRKGKTGGSGSQRNTPNHCNNNNGLRGSVQHNGSGNDSGGGGEDSSSSSSRDRGSVDSSPFPVHLRNVHGPCGRGEVEAERNTGLFAIVVCRRPSDGKFLMVQEFASTGFWVPGGQLDAGESLCAAVARETFEEAGLRITLKGVVDCDCKDRGRWRRITFYAEPAVEQGDEQEGNGGTNGNGGGNGHNGNVGGSVSGGGGGEEGGREEGDPAAAGLSPPLSSRWSCRGRRKGEEPKTLPDYESTGACWVSLDELPLLRLRGHEPARLFPYVAKELSRGGASMEGWSNCGQVVDRGRIFPLEIPPEFKSAFADVPF
mmetsp:Transcript_42839/g.79400  ORF Transcript_42839/g.79400 Transcript_42839/m.79400 type:complete len:394 (+) Transcript_42839:648-1829(+)